jgi:hypothetical protein
MGTNLKWRNALWEVVLAGACWVAVGGGPATAYAQKPPTAAVVASPSEQDITVIDAQRGALDRFLDAHPEIEEEVVNNPSSLSDTRFLRDHAVMQAFLESHPLVKADPRAFLSPSEWRYQNRHADIDNILSYLVPSSVFVCFLLAALWVVRTLLETRRWNRSFKMHEDLHTKLIEKFASGQDFGSYLQSDAGRRLLEWTPPVIDASRGLPNAVSRILWSLQAGVVLFLVGIGLILLRGQMSSSATPPLLVFGTLGLTLGAGFILSALISYGLSKRLGLVGGPAQGSDLALKH